MSERRTLGWYMQHPRAFDAAVEAWQQSELDRYLDGGMVGPYDHVPPPDCDEPEECTCRRSAARCERRAA